MATPRRPFLLSAAGLPIACARSAPAEGPRADLAAAATRIAAQPATGPVAVAALPLEVDGSANAPLDLGYLFVERSGQPARIVRWAWVFRAADGTQYAEVIGPQYTSSGPALAPRATLRWSARVLLDAGIVAAAHRRGESSVTVVTEFDGIDSAGAAFSTEAHHTVRFR